MINQEKIEQGSSAELAAFWKAREMSGEMSAGERAAMAQWLATDENQKAYAELETAIERSEEACVGALADELEHELAAFADHEERANGFWRRLAPRGAMRIAASVALAVAVGATALTAVDWTSPERFEHAAQYATNIGEDETAGLPDGSTVALNTSTDLSVNYNADRRLAQLERGEAVFDVARDKDRPFFVQTPHAEIKVTGTVFDVKTSADESVVYVISGAVNVRPRAGGDALLLAGDKIAIDASGAAGPVSRFDASLLLAWRSGAARFRETPLAEVVSELNRYFASPLVLSDPSLGALPVTGEFDIDDQSAAVDALTLIFDLETRRDGNEVVLYRIN